MSSPGLGLRGDRVSSRRNLPAALAILYLVGGFAPGLSAQYVGKVAKTDKDQPVLRSVAVLEWVGDAGKPSASRLVPVTVYDGEQLNDGTIYLSRPAPLALTGGVEYELQTAGKPTGIFDVFSAGEINGAWEGFGVWKSLSAVEAVKAKNSFNTSTLYGSHDDAESDVPVLHRKHAKGSDSDDGGGSSGSAPGGDTPAKQSGTSGSGSGSSDPDRPTLKRKTGDDSSASGSGSGASDSSSAGKGNLDPDRPTLHRSHKSSDSGAETSNAPLDPDRPRLRHGKPDDLAAAESPKLVGSPPNLQQAVAVSDAGKHAEHPWKYTWANLDDEAKFKSSLEAMARTALGMDAPPAPAKKTTATRRPAKTPLEPPAPAPLADEQFHVFELTYGATATMVLTASTPKPATPAATQSDDEPAPPVIKRGKPTSSASAMPTQSKSQPVPKPSPQKFVTLIAQPDLYGGVVVLYKSVTDSAHLDQTPRMRLVDAVDAMADNRGELLFELRGDGQRQFVLFRVLRGSAEQLFATVAIP